MSLNVCNLKEALVMKFMNDECLNDLLQMANPGGSNIDPWTAQPRIQVAETTPETLAESPYVGIEILNTKPFVKDSVTNWFRSNIMIAVDSHKSLRSTQIMDHIQCLLNYPQEGDNFNKPLHSFCCDISNGCIKGRLLTDFERIRVGRQGSNTYNLEFNNWEELIMVEAIWSPCSCEPEDGCNEMYNPCPIILPHSTSHPACNCPE